MSSYYKKLVDLSYSYYDNVYSANLLLNDDSNNKKKSIFNNFKKNIIPFKDDIKQLYCFIKSSINDTTNRWEFPIFVKDFIQFMKNCEKVFLYNNDESNTVYAEVDDLKKIYKLIIDSDQYKITYEFQDSSINLPNTIKKLSVDNPLSFLMDENEEEQTVQFISITIERNFGKNLISEFKFIDKSPIPFEDYGDNVLFSIAINISREIIFNTFIDIIDNCICPMAGMKQNIKIEEVVKNGGITVR